MWVTAGGKGGPNLHGLQDAQHAFSRVGADPHRAHHALLAQRRQRGQRLAQQLPHVRELHVVALHLQYKRVLEYLSRYGIR